MDVQDELESTLGSVIASRSRERSVAGGEAIPKVQLASKVEIASSLCSSQ